MKTAVSTPASIRTEESDVLPVLGPDDLAAFAFHALNKFIWISSVLQYVVDGLDQMQLPAVGVEASLILAGLRPFYPGLLLYEPLPLLPPSSGACSISSKSG